MFDSLRGLLPNPFASKPETAKEDGPSFWDRAKAYAAPVMEKLAEANAAKSVEADHFAAGLLQQSFAHQEDIDLAFEGKSADDVQRIRAAYDATNGEGAFAARFGSDTGRWASDDVAATPEERAKQLQDREAMAMSAVDQIVAAEELGYVYDSMNGEKILGAIRGKTKAEIAEIRKLFRERTGKDLDTWIDGAVGLDDPEVVASLSGDPEASVLASIEAACGGDYDGTDVEKVMNVLEGLPEERRAEFVEKHGGEIRAKLAMEMGGSFDFSDDLLRATALLDGDTATVAMVDIRNANGIFTEDEAKMQTALESLGSDAEKQKFRDSFGDEADAILGASLSSAELALAEMTQTTAAAAGGEGALDAKIRLAKMDLAVSGWNDNDALLEAVELTDEERRLPPAEQAKIHAERKQLLETYWKEKHPDQPLDDMLAAETQSMFGGETLDSKRADMALGQGKMSDGFALFYATKGAGTREDLIKEVTAGKTREEMLAAAEEYMAYSGEALPADPAERRLAAEALLKEALAGDLDGREQHDAIGALTYGNKFDPADAKSIALLAAKEAYDFDFELGSGEGSAMKAREGDSSKDDFMRLQHERIQKLAAKAAAGQPLTPEEQAQITRGMRHQSGNIEAWRADADRIADTGSQVAAATVGVIATIASCGTLGPLVGAALGSLIGSGAGMVVKGAVKGDGYGGEEMLLDGGKAALQAAVASFAQTDMLGNFAGGLGGKVSNEILQTIIEEGVKGAATGLVGGIGGGLLDEKTYEAGGFESLLGSTGLQMLGGAAGNIFSAGGKGLLAKNPAFAKSMLLNPRAAGALTGFLGGAAGGAAQTGVEAAATGQFDLDKLFLSVGLGGLSNAAQGIAEGQAVLDKRDVLDQIILEHGAASDAALGYFDDQEILMPPAEMPELQGDPRDVFAPSDDDTIMHVPEGPSDFEKSLLALGYDQDVTLSGKDALGNDRSYESKSWVKKYFEQVEAMHQMMEAQTPHEMGLGSPESLARGKHAANVLSNEEWLALNIYTSEKYQQMNPALRGRGPDGMLEQIQPLIDLATSGMEKLPVYDGDTLRGTGLRPESFAQYEQGLADQQPFVGDKAFQSTTTDESVAATFAQNNSGPGKIPAVMQFEHQSGRSVEFLSEYKDELEVLLPPGIMVMVDEIIDKGDYKLIKQKEVK